MQLAAGIQLVRHDPEVRSIILKSNVPGVFCAGADLKERKEMSEREVWPSFCVYILCLLHYVGVGMYVCVCVCVC